MPRIAPVAARWQVAGMMRLILIAALIFGGSYTLAAWFEYGGFLSIIWKGAGVALLALWVLTNTSGSVGKGMAAVLGFGALGDVLLAVSTEIGAVAFLIGHLIAAYIYTQNRSFSPIIAPIVAVLTAISGFSLTHSPVVAVYAATLGLMAGSATASRLPRSITAGAWLFVASDLLIFARLGPLAHSFVPTLLVWPLYFVGQALIASGAVKAFGRPSVRA